MKVRACLVSFFIAIFGCSPAPDAAPATPAGPQPTQTAAPTQSQPDPAAEMDEHVHTHVAPHDGTLIMLGDHVANIELVLNEGIGALTAYVLDGEAENGVPISVPGLDLEVSINDGAPQTLTLLPAENVLTGETKESTSQFTAQFDVLRGVRAFRGTIAEITVRGVTFKNIPFAFP